MRLISEVDSFGRLVCTLLDGRNEVRVTSLAPASAAAALIAALDDASRDGCGECYWQEGGGDYRWLFRRDGANLRIAVLWATGIVTGWEQVFWWEGAFGEGESGLRNGLVALTATH